MGLPVKFVLLLLLQWVCLHDHSEALTSSSIPPILLNCYQSNVTNSIPRTPLNVQVLTELIRKLEFDIGNAMNIRILTNALLHSIRLDGVERTAHTSPNEFAFPFRASGKQFHKFRLIVDYLTPGDGLQFPADAVSVHERCLLHFMISNTIDSWERGDERTSCQVKSMDLRQRRQVISITERQRSACPIEKGVIKTRWGTVSPGHLISGLASVYHANPIQFQEVVDDLKGEINIKQSFRENTTSQMVNNLLVSTVVGDLAEIILNQPVRNPAFGNPGYWNSTTYPTAHYLNKIQWDMTSAELLGGIDGLVLSNKILEWTSILKSTRLSQVVDMYYSERGIGYDRKYRACERNSKLAQLFSGVDLVSETSAAAKLLQEIGQFNEYIYEEGIDALAKDAVENYRHMADGLTRKYDACEQGGDNITKLEIITILDGTWQPHEVHSLISYLAELADVSYYGSKLGVINGQTGSWMVNVTTDVIKIFGALSNVTSWPSTLQLSTGLGTIINYYQNQTYEECRVNYARPMGYVILILANTALITDVDTENTRAAIRSLKNTRPEIKIIYVTSETNAFNYERIASGSDYHIIKSSNNIGAFVGQISAKLNNLPATFMNFHCNNSEVRMEDYVTPGVNTLYEVHSEYVRRTDISVKFKGYDYADFSVCAYDSNSPQNMVCRGITGNAEVNFTARDYCPQQHACTVQFSISANNTKNRCAEKDCRYPDQARLDIIASWRSRSTSFMTPNLVLLSALVYTLVFICKSYS